MIKKIITLSSLLFSFILVGTFIAAAIQAEMYYSAGALIIVFLVLMKVQDIDYFKITKSSLEVKDESDKK